MSLQPLFFPAVDFGFNIHPDSFHGFGLILFGGLHLANNSDIGLHYAKSDLMSAFGAGIQYRFLPDYFISFEGAILSSTKETVTGNVVNTQYTSSSNGISLMLSFNRTIF